MRLIMGCATTAILLQLAAHSEVIRFDNAAPGSLPAGWSVGMTHAGGAPRWEVVRDDTAPHPPFVLAQLSRDATAGRIPLAVWKRVTVRNVEVSVALKSVDMVVWKIG